MATKKKTTKKATTRTYKQKTIAERRATNDRVRQKLGKKYQGTHMIPVSDEYYQRIMRLMRRSPVCSECGRKLRIAVVADWVMKAGFAALGEEADEKR